MTLSVNGKDVGDAVIALVPNDVLLRVSDLARSGISRFAGTRRVLFGDAYVSLRSLEPAFTYTFDIASLQLSVVAQSAKVFGTNRVDLAQAAPANARYERTGGAFLNYTIAGSTVAHPDAFVENGFTLAHALLYNTLSYNAGAGLRRGITQVVFDDRPKLQRIVVGDAPITTGLLGGFQVLGGVVVTRQFGLDPYLLTFPTPSLRGEVLLPSQADIYVNGRLVRTIDLQPGQFVLNDVPTDIGLAQTRIVIRNALGVTTQQTNDFFSTSGLLRPGLSDFAFGAGLVRASNGFSGGYGGPAVLARYARGISNRFTAGGRLEAEPGVISGGLSAVRTIGVLAGVLSVNASGAGGNTGTAAALQLSAPSRGAVALGGSLQWQSLHYATSSLSPTQGRALFEAQLDASLLLSRSSSLSVSIFNTVPSTGAPQSALTVGLSQQLGHQLSLYAQATRVRGNSLLGAVTQNAFSLNLQRTIGRRDNVGIRTSASSGSGGSSRTTSISFSHAIDGAFGLGYDADAGLGNTRDLSASANYQGSLGSAQAFFSTFAGSSSVDLSYAGGLAYIQKHVFLTRTIEDAYGLVEVPGLAGAEVYSNGRMEGRTDRSGFLLLPDLVSQLPNDVHVLLPSNVLDATITGATTDVIPDFRSAVTFPYEVQRVQAILLSLLLQAKKGAAIVPEYGEFTLTSARGLVQSSEIDGAGRAYFNELLPGRYSAEIEYVSQRCRFVLDIPPHDQVVLDLGVKTCTER